MNIHKYINNKYIWLDDKINLSLGRESLLHNVIYFDDFFDSNIFELVIIKILKWNMINVANTSDDINKNIVNLNYFLVKDLFLEEFWNFILSEEFLNFFTPFYWEDIYTNFKRFKDNVKWLFFIKMLKQNFLRWHTDLWPKYKLWNLVFYLNNEWKSEYWWLLELWIKEGSQFIVKEKILPLPNRLVLLKATKSSWHKIWDMKVDKERFFYSLELWYDKKFENSSLHYDR